LIVIVLAVSAGCTTEAAIEVDLLDPDGADQVWVDGDTERLAVEGRTLRIPHSGADTIALRFARDDEVVGVMTIAGLLSAPRVALRRVWFDEGVAFPSDVEVEGAGFVAINGLRMGSSNRLRGAMKVEGTVLAAGGEGEPLLVRPLDSALPDVPARLAVDAVVVTTGGEPGTLRGLTFGDTVRLEGVADGGFLFASKVTVSRRSVVAVPAPPEAKPRETRPEERSDASRRNEKAEDEKRARERGGPRLGRFSPGSG
jgi:hypothetical protein